MELKDFLAKAHLYIELNCGTRISQKEMADELGISLRTYSEYLNGRSSPLGIEVILKLFTLLKDEQTKTLISEWCTKEKEKERV